MAGEDGEKAEAVTGSAPLAERAANNHAAASTPQRPPAQETPLRMASASAFSVFMSPLVRGSGRINCQCACSTLLLLLARRPPNRCTIQGDTTQCLGQCLLLVILPVSSLSDCNAFCLALTDSEEVCHPELHVNAMAVTVVTSAMLRHGTTAGQTEASTRHS